MGPNNCAHGDRVQHPRGVAKAAALQPPQARSMEATNPLDRRKTPRFPQRNVFGSISYPKRKAPISCLVRDLSRSGAKIWTLAVKIVPDDFTLTLDESGEHATCLVIWRSETEIGVVFESMPPF